MSSEAFRNTDVDFSPCSDILLAWWLNDKIKNQPIIISTALIRRQSRSLWQQPVGFWFSPFCCQLPLLSYTVHLRGRSCFHAPLPSPGSHFLSNVMLIKIDLFPPWCSGRDTGDNNTPFVESAHAYWEEAEHPEKEPSGAMFLSISAIVLMQLHTNRHVCIKLNLWSIPWP